MVPALEADGNRLDGDERMRVVHSMEFRTAALPNGIINHEYLLINETWREVTLTPTQSTRILIMTD